jgi:hypothetical protein
MYLSDGHRGVAFLLGYENEDEDFIKETISSFIEKHRRQA